MVSEKVSQQKPIACCPELKNHYLFYGIEKVRGEPKWTTIVLK